MRKSFVALLIALLVSLFGCGSDEATRPNDFTPLTAITITAATANIANLTSTQLTAVGNFSGLFTRDITADVVWVSNDTGVATVSSSGATIGRATAVAPGTSTITASLDGISGSFNLTVSNAGINSIALSPLTPSTPKGLTTQFTATGTFFDPATSITSTQDITFDATWASVDLTVATISNTVGSKGLASTVDVGTSNISATLGGVSGSTLMTVTPALLTAISITPLTPSLLNLTDLQFSATGTYTDASSVDITSLVTWATAPSTIAGISNATGTQGLASALREGSTSVSASLDGVTASTLLAVTGGNLSAINVLPAASTQVILSPVLPVQMSAEGVFPNGTRDITDRVTWTSSNTIVATVDSQGVVSPLWPGTTEIKAEISINGSITSGTTNLIAESALFTLGSLVVSPATTDLPTITPLTSLPFTVSGSFSNGLTRDLTTEVNWTSSSANATISNTPPDVGIATGASAGNSILTANYRGVDSDTATLIVKAPVLLSISIDTPGGTLQSGERLQLTATAQYTSDPVSVDITRDVTWTSADPFRAIFHDPAKAPGELVGVDSGTVVITATFEGQTDTVTFTLP